MKKIVTILSVIAVFGCFSQAEEAKSCPVSGKPVKENVKSSYEGKDVFFCCKNCKSKFAADPKNLLIN
jgi:YHS domain-containing protein